MSDSMKKLANLIYDTNGIDPLDLTPEEQAIAVKLISKLSAPVDPVRQGLGKITGEALNLLLDGVCSRDENNGTLDLIRKSASLLFQAWIEEEGEEKVGNILGAFYENFEKTYKGSPKDLLEKGKSAVMWLINELDVAEYASENPLVSSSGDLDLSTPF